MNNRYFIIDFDSTFVSVEALDELAKIVLRGNADAERIVCEIEEITKMGMEGKITFPESLSRRVQLFSIHKDHISELIPFLQSKVSDSVVNNKQFFVANADNIYIISGGFRDYIVPVVANFGIASDHVLANEFVFDENGNVLGFDTANYLAQTQGKVKQLNALSLEGEIVVIGDGYTDYEMREGRDNCLFYAFTENVSREKVVQKADLVVKGFGEIVSG